MANKSLKGQLLLDKGSLTGSFFQRTVVFICEHDQNGAFGLVLNRGTETRFGDALVADLPSVLKRQPLFIGGPVQPQALSYLHTTSISSQGNIIPRLSVGHSLDQLMELFEPETTKPRLRIFAGYSGWSPGQLDDEMARGAWLTHPANLSLVFYSQPEELWKHILLKQNKWEYQLLAQSPDDLAAN